LILVVFKLYLVLRAKKSNLFVEAPLLLIDSSSDRIFNHNFLVMKKEYILGILVMAMFVATVIYLGIQLNAH